MLISPEIIIFSFLNSSLKFLETQKGSDWLEKLFGTLSLDRYSFKNQSKTIFSRRVDDPRKITVDLSYNKKQDKPISIFLSLGSESSSSSSSMGVGYSEEYISNTNSIQNSYNRRFEQNLSIFIYSDNSNETLIVYNVFKSLLILTQQYLDLEGLNNLTISGGDITQYPDFIPKTFFYRVISLRFSYESKIPGIDNQVLINCLKLDSNAEQ